MTQTATRVTWDPEARWDVSTWLRGYLDAPWPFAETVARIERASGQPVWAQAGDKTTFEATGTFEGEVFTLYDYRGGTSIHIGGQDALDVERLRSALLAELGAAGK